jgi:hypothetical protein
MQATAPNKSKQGLKAIGDGMHTMMNVQLICDVIHEDLRRVTTGVICY